MTGILHIVKDNAFKEEESNSNAVKKAGVLGIYDCRGCLSK